MSIAIQCQGCGRSYNLDDRFAGQTVKCKQCGGPIVVPGAQQPPATKAPPVKSSAPRNQPLPPPVQPSGRARAAVPPVKLSAPQYKSKKSGGILKILATVAGVCLLGALAIGRAYLRHTARVERRQAAAHQAGEKNVPQRPLATASEASSPVGTSSHGNSDEATIFVQGVPQGLGKVVSDQLVKLSGATGLSATSTREGEETITIRPVRDVAALAAKIDFGSVIEMDEQARSFTVRVDASKLPQPLPPEVTKASAPDFYRQNLADLKSPDTDRRKRAVIRFKEAPPKDLKTEIATALLELLAQSDDASVRAEIEQALPVWATADEAVPALIARLKDRDASVVGQAARALGRYKDARAAGPLLDLRGPHHFDVDYALKEIGAAAEPALLERINDSDANVRRDIIGFLGELGTEKSEPALSRLLNDDDGSIKYAAEQALQKIRQRRR